MKKHLSPAMLQGQVSDLCEQLAAHETQNADLQAQVVRLQRRYDKVEAFALDRICPIHQGHPTATCLDGDCVEARAALTEED